MTSPRFIDACRFAVLKHADQIRKAVNHTNVPYVVHPLEAAQILAECGVTDEDVLIAAVLHDTLEDTTTEPNDLLFQYGQRVLDIVQEVTDNPELTREAQRIAQIDSAPHKSYAAKLVKCADKTSNMRDIIRCPPGWKLDNMQKYAMHARDVVRALNGNSELPPQLAALFWQASGHVLEWVAERRHQDAPEGTAKA